MRGAQTPSLHTAWFCSFKFHLYLELLWIWNSWKPFGTLKRITVSKAIKTFCCCGKWHRKEANPSTDTIYGGKTFSCQGEHLTNSFYSRKSSGPFLSNLAQCRYDAYRMHYVYFSFSSKNSINSAASQSSFVIGNYSLAALRPKYLHVCYSISCTGSSKQGSSLCASRNGVSILCLSHWLRTWTFFAFLWPSCA